MKGAAPTWNLATATPVRRRRGSTSLVPASLGFVMALEPSLASPASLESRPDGTLLLTVLGEKLVVRAEDAEQVRITGRNAQTCVEDEFGKLGFDPKPPQSLGNSLARWLADPVKARCFESLAPTEVGDGRGVFKVFFNVGRNGRLLYFPETDLFHKRNGIWFGGWSITIGHEGPDSPDYCGKIDPTGSVDTNGYRQAFDAVNGFSAFSRVKEMGGRPTCIFCAPLQGCFDQIPSPNAFVSVTLSWWQRSSDNWSVRTSSADWTEFDLAARRFEQAILPYRANEDFK